MLARSFFMQNMYSIFECTHGMRLFKSEVLASIALFFAQDCHPIHFVVYFSGHGNRQTGNWILTDGEITLQDIYDLFISYAPLASCISIIADCCHSGSWVDQLTSRPLDLDINRLSIQASCQRDEVCWDTKVGGLFTKSWVSGEYTKLAKRQLWEHHGQAQLDDIQTSLKNSLSSWLPWSRFLANNPALLSCTFLASSTAFTCSKECSALTMDSDLEDCQHPVSSHPWVFGLIFFDSRFATMNQAERFPPVDLKPSHRQQQQHPSNSVAPGGSSHPEGVPRDYIPAQRSHIAFQTTHNTLHVSPVTTPCKYIDLKDFWLGGS